MRNVFRLSRRSGEKSYSKVIFSTWLPLIIPRRWWHRARGNPYEFRVGFPFSSSTAEIHTSRHLYYRYSSRFVIVVNFSFAHAKGKAGEKKKGKTCIFTRHLLITRFDINILPPCEASPSLSYLHYQFLLLP